MVPEEGVALPPLFVCLTPALLPLYDLSDKVVVVIDILRATTTMCVALDNGVTRLAPVETIEECAAYAERGYLCAAERNGEVAPGFTRGNSPFSFMGPEMRGAQVALTTTNGTKAIRAARAAEAVVIGAFANLSVLATWLRARRQPTIMLCAGWKDRVNLEDTIFAGAMAHHLAGAYRHGDDACILALSLFEAADARKRKYMGASSHYRRMIQLNLQKDVKYCLRQDTHPVLPILVGDHLTPAVLD